MQFEGRRRTGEMPNLTPLIDVVFLLLIFFMLTSHFVREQSLNIELPVAESGEVHGEDDRLEVVVDAGGRYLIHDHFVEPAVLEQTLRSELAGRKEKIVRIRGDRAAALGQAVAVIDAAKRAGASGVDMVTERR